MSVVEEFLILRASECLNPTEDNSSARKRQKVNRKNPDEKSDTKSAGQKSNLKILNGEIILGEQTKGRPAKDQTKKMQNQIVKAPLVSIDKKNCLDARFELAASVVDSLRPSSSSSSSATITGIGIIFDFQSSCVHGFLHLIWLGFRYFAFDVFLIVWFMVFGI